MSWPDHKVMGTCHSVPWITRYVFPVIWAKARKKLPDNRPYMHRSASHPSHPPPPPQTSWNPSVMPAVLDRMVGLCLFSMLSDNGLRDGVSPSDKGALEGACRLSLIHSRMTPARDRSDKCDSLSLILFLHSFPSPFSLTLSWGVGGGG